MSAYSNPRRGGINAISIRENDELIEAELTDGTQDIVLGTHHGQAIRFKETDARAMGRTASGVRGIRLRKDDFVVGMVVIKRGYHADGRNRKWATASGGSMQDYRITRRGGKGIITIKTTEKVGNMVTIQEVVDDDDLMIITAKGVIIRLKLQGVNIIGRNTQGVRLIRLDEGDRIADVTRVAKTENDNIDDEQLDGQTEDSQESDTVPSDE